jgi:TRAP-type transport system periplasmic protein
MKKSKLLALLLALAMVLSLAACGSKDSGSTDNSSAPASSDANQQDESTAPENDGKTYNLRMSCEASEGQWLAVMLQDYADAVKEATNGQVNIELYLGNSLGSSDDIWSMFTQGAIDMVHMGVAHAGNFPVTDFVQTPFAVDSPEMAASVMAALADAGYLAEFTDNMHVVAYMPTLMQEFMFKDREVKSFSDLSGLVIRGSSSPLVSCIEAVGSTATSIPITDLYMSLSQGVADATITSVDAAEVFKLQDVCKYLLDMPISTGMNFVAINNTLWNSLPADIQEAMDKVGAEYQEKYLELNRQAGDDCVKTMTDGGMTVLEPSDELVAACKDATSGMIDDLIEKLNGEGLDGAAIVACAQDAVANYAG